MSDFAAEEDRAAVLEGRLRDAGEVLGARWEAYERINNRYYGEEDEDNPQSPPRGEAQSQVSEGQGLVRDSWQIFNGTTPPSEEALDGVELTLEVIEGIVDNTPADELLSYVPDDEDDGCD